MLRCLFYDTPSPARPPVHLPTTVVLSMSQEIQNFTDYKANNRQTQKVVVFSRSSAMLAFEYLAPFSFVLILCCTRMDWEGRTATEGKFHLHKVYYTVPVRIMRPVFSSFHFVWFGQHHQTPPPMMMTLMTISTMY